MVAPILLSNLLKDELPVMHSVAAPKKVCLTPSGVRILYIAGLGRSGSTILDRILGSQPGFHSGGELDMTWSHGVLEDRLCSCGQPFSACTFWAQVRFVDPELLTREAATRVQNYHDKVLRPRWMWQLWWERGRHRISAKAPDDYFDRIARLYRAISRVTGGMVIVDSSKHPTYAYLLARSGVSSSIEIIHLVRDPRAVAYSWARRRVEPGVTDRTIYMHRHGPAEAATLWVEWNRTVELLAAKCRMPYRRLRYEDFTNDPAGSLRQLGLGIADLDGTPSWAASSSRREMHILSGNPARFELGPDSSPPRR